MITVTAGSQWRVTGVLLHAHGTLRLLSNESGRLHVEVVGFEDEASRAWLAEIAGQLEDAVSELCVCDEPEEYGLLGFFSVPRERHTRRAS